MQPGDRVHGRFVIERLAGAGGMGAVFRALDLETSQPVALKVLAMGNAEGIDRFREEARLLAESDHPGIVRFVAHGETERGDPFIAMEWLEGEDLSVRLARRGLTVSESITVISGAAAALAGPHARRIVHRDVKPSNIFLVDRDVEKVKILDFGIARGATSAALTQTGKTIGTPAYMAPEQARGERNLDPRADVFSLGSVLFECLTGQQAFSGDHAVAVLAKILFESPPSVASVFPEVPPALDILLSRMLAKAREERPLDASAVAAELGRLSRADVHYRAPRSRKQIALTREEQEIVSVLLAASSGDLGVGDKTIDATLVTSKLDAVGRALVPFGGRVELLPDGSLFVVIAGHGSATDRAAHGAKTALALKNLLTDAPLVLATGRGQMKGRMPVGDVIDGAVRLARAVSSGAHQTKKGGGLYVDTVTAGLLDGRFEIGPPVLGGAASGFELVRERPTALETRTLLGRPTPFVGRERELRMLEGYFEECEAESVARAILVTGAAGVGKSRLRYELIRGLRDRDPSASIWIARGEPMATSSAFGLIASAIQFEAGILGGEPSDERQGKLAQWISRRVPESDRSRVTEFLGEAVGVRFPDTGRVELQTARTNPVVMGDQIRRAIDDLLLAVTERGPLLFVIEDLHWGDLASMKALDQSLRNLAERPLMVVAFARPVIHEVAPKLWEERRLQVIRLEEMSRRASEKLARHALGDTITKEGIERIVERAGGNAYYLEELIRAASEGRDDLPETVLAVAHSRVEALSPESRRVLRAASIFGQVFWQGGVVELAGGAASRGEVETELVALAEREILAKRATTSIAGEVEYAFRHALVHEAAYASLTDNDKKLGHRLAARWLEPTSRALPIVLAAHFEHGGETERAIGCYLRAAEDELGGNDLAGAIECAERGIAAGAKDAELAALHLVQAISIRWQGDYKETARRARVVVSLSPERSPTWYAALALAATAASRFGDRALVREALELFERATAAQGGPWSAEGIQSAAQLVVTLHNAGELALGGSLLDAVDRQVASIGVGPLVTAHVARARSYRALSVGDAGAHLDHARESFERFRESGEIREACIGGGIVGYAHLDVGLYEEAERLLSECRAQAERMGLRPAVHFAEHNLGWALLRTGKASEAEAMERRVIDATDAPDRRLAAVSRTYLARIFLEMGRAEEAEAEARASFDPDFPPAIRAFARAALAVACIARGRNEEALRAAEEAMAAVESAGGSVEEGESFVRLAHVDALLACRKVAEARDVVRVAAERIETRAAKISNPSYRASFIERVPENARTVELARASSSWALD